MTLFSRFILIANRRSKSIQPCGTPLLRGAKPPNLCLPSTSETCESSHEEPMYPCLLHIPAGDAEGYLDQVLKAFKSLQQSRTKALAPPPSQLQQKSLKSMTGDPQLTIAYLVSFQTCTRETSDKSRVLVVTASCHDVITTVNIPCIAQPGLFQSLLLS